PHLELEPRPDPWQRRISKGLARGIRLGERERLEILLDWQERQHPPADVTLQITRRRLESPCRRYAGIVRHQSPLIVESGFHGGFYSRRGRNVTCPFQRLPS